MKTNTVEISRMLDAAVTVGELIEMLGDFSTDAKVVFRSDYGDYHHTQQLLFVQKVEEINASQTVKSAYSHSGLALVTENEDVMDVASGDEASEIEDSTVIVLS